MKILTEATPLALWHEAVQEAQLDCQIALKEDVQAYLVYLLMRNTTNPKLAHEVMASRFLEGISRSRHQKGQILQTVGDHCLLITGLFPAMAEKRRVKVRYYVELGQTAYEVISRENNDIFSLLSQQFVILMDVLQSFRPYTAATFPASYLDCIQALKKK